jgi:hypothetical protein
MFHNVLIGIDGQSDRRDALARLLVPARRAVMHEQADPPAIRTEVPA